MRSTLAHLLPILAGCPDTSVSTINAPPVAEIVTPSAGETPSAGSITAQGIVEDPDGPSEELLASWLLDGDEVCPELAPDASGNISCALFLPSGSRTLTLVVRDPQGKSDSDAVSLEVLPYGEPWAQISEPTAGGVYYSDQLIEFSGEVGDQADSSADLLVWWEASGVQGQLDVDAEPDGGGTVMGWGTLPEGEHAVSLHVENSGANTASDSVIIQVGPPNSAPGCALLSPADDSTVSLGETVIFEAEVQDADVPADWLEVSWQSDKDGALGSSTPNSAGEVTFAYGDLSADTHLVSMTVSDELGETCTDDVLLTVGSPPSVSISAPSDGSVVNQGQAASFTATVSDDQDAASSLALVWSSSIDGELGTSSADSSGAVSFTTSDLSVGEHSISLQASDSQGLLSSDSVGLVINGLPSAPAVSLTPSSATTSDALVVSLDSPSVDPEKDSVSYSYAWFLDGTASSASSSDTLPASATTKGETWSVEVTPSDAWGAGELGSASLTIANAAPSAVGAIITPDPAHTGDTLVCELLAFTDPDGDADASSYSWDVGGSAAGSGSSLAGAFAYGDLVTCTATPSDGTDSGSAHSASITIGNAPPVLASVSLTPTTAYEGDTLLCTPGSTSDADGGSSFSYAYAWSVDGSDPGVSDATLGSSHFDRDQEVFCTVTPSDGVDAGSAVDSNAVLISNSVPTAPTVSIQPSDPTAGEDDLLCSIDVPSSDADGDSIGYAFAWAVDGASYGATSTTTHAGDTILASDHLGGESWACTVTPSDGTDIGPTASASVMVLDGDGDGDGVPADEDCDDGDASVGAESTWYIDYDGDGYGSDAYSTVDCYAPSGYVGNDEDCDDSDAGIGPISWYADVDADGYGDPLSELSQCTAPSGYVSDASDCDDSDANVNPAATETCDEVDEDCNGVVDDAVAGCYLSISTAHQTTCGIKTDYSIECWGDDTYGEGTGPSGEWIQVGASEHHSCAVDLDGFVTCWGNDAGTGRVTGAPTDPVLEIAGGLNDTCAILEDESAMCWGDSTSSGLWTVPSGSFVELDCWSSHTCGITTSGALTCWGVNLYGETGTWYGYSDVGVGAFHTCGVSTSGTIDCWGITGSGGGRAHGQVDHAPSDSGYVTVGSGDYHNCALKSSGYVTCWGNDVWGQATPPSVPFEQIVVGAYHNCGLKSDGTVQCWGDDSAGQSSPP